MQTSVRPIIAGHDIVRNIVRTAGWKTAKVICNNARLVVNIDSTDGIKIKDCEVTTQQLRSVIDLKLLLLNGVEVSSTEFNSKAHAALKVMCYNRKIIVSLPLSRIARRQSGILRLTINTIGSRILQLFSLASKSVVLSSLVDIGTNIKLREPQHCTTFVNRKIR